MKSVFYDINKKKAAGEALDLMDAVSYQQHSFEAYAGSIGDMRDADIIINSLGQPRKPGQTHLDIMGSTIAATKEFLPLIEKSGFEGIIVSLTNPCDIVAEYIHRKLDWPKEKIIGSGTSLDSARLQMHLSSALRISRSSLTAYVLGEHGDSSMIPWSHVLVAGKPLEELLKEKPEKYNLGYSFDGIMNLVHKGGAIENKAKGCTEFGVTSATAAIVRAIYHDEHKIIPCSVYLNGQYGVEDVFASVPAKIGMKGVEDIIEIALTDEEHEKFLASCKVLKDMFDKAKDI